MTDTPQPEHEPTAVDDVRRVREKIAQQHRGNLQEHIAETNRIGQELRAKLGVRLVESPAQRPRRSGTQG